MKKTTILIADDHTLIRQAWNLILSSDERFEVVGEAGSGEEAVQLVEQLRPDIVIMDINLPGITGIEATQIIRKLYPATKVLGVSMHTQPAFVRRMLKQGAMGYVTKNSSREELCKAILEIKSNRKYVCEEIKDILSEQMICKDEERNGFNSLSQREIEIIGLIKKGYSSKEIAEPLSITVKTVDVHRYNILKKLNLKNTAAMVNYINNSQLGN